MCFVSADKENKTLSTCALIIAAAQAHPRFKRLFEIATRQHRCRPPDLAFPVDKLCVFHYVEKKIRFWRICNDVLINSCIQFGSSFESASEMKQKGQRAGERFAFLILCMFSSTAHCLATYPPAQQKIANSKPCNACSFVQKFPSTARIGNLVPANVPGTAPTEPRCLNLLHNIKFHVKLLYHKLFWHITRFHIYPIIFYYW